MALELIYDRTEEDAARWRELSTKLDKQGWSALTQAEQLQWLTQLKGGYNYTDLNRVGIAVSYLGQCFRDLLTHLVDYRERYGAANDALFRLPYTAEDIAIRPKTDWALGDPVWADQAAQYLANLSILRSLLPLSSDVPQVPPDIADLTVQEANDIEKLLFDLDAEIAVTTKKVEKWIRDTAAAWVYSGDTCSGEV